MNRAPFGQGYVAARRGEPSSANPFPKPATLPSGEDYPGDWCGWLKGWCMGREYSDQDASRERAKLYRMTIEGFGNVGQ